jgi:hypothetical protein
MALSDILGKLSDSISQIRVKSVVDNPMKMVLLLVLMAVVAACFHAPTWVLIVVFSFVFLFALVAVFFSIFFSFKNPDYLRSESFQIKMRTLEYLGDKDGGLLPTNPKDIIYSPQVPVARIEEEKEEDI